MEGLGIPHLFQASDEQKRLEYLRASRKYLDENRPEYELAREKWHNLAWCHQSLQECREALIDIQAHNPSDEPQAAVYRIAVATERIGRVFSQVAIMESYESMRATFDQHKTDEVQ